MVEGGGLGVFHAKEVGPLSVHVPNGVVDMVAVDEAHAVQLAKKYGLSFAYRVEIQYKVEIQSEVPPPGRPARVRLVPICWYGGRYLAYFQGVTPPTMPDGTYACEDQVRVATHLPSSVLLLLNSARNASKSVRASHS